GGSVGSSSSLGAPFRQTCRKQSSSCCVPTSSPSCPATSPQVPPLQTGARQGVAPGHWSSFVQLFWQVPPLIPARVSHSSSPSHVPLVSQIKSTPQISLPF